ncbi:hypothetical protein VZT92_001797 [Zoarces viviparus]|uniref:Uncharacterized protein n=1 Tax=Zoarces viviparus TaxID=48416 RepID=A0AAW1G3P1_ZOAVI
MVWHSLSACGFGGLAPEQLGSIGCHIQPPAAVKDGRAGDECCPPVCVIKTPLTTASGHLGTRRLTSLVHIKALSQKTARCEELE